VLFYIARRLLGLIPILLGISIVIFLALRLLPGDVAIMILTGGDDSSATPTPEALATLREQLGLSRPLWSQYASWIYGLLHLDAGTSLWTNEPVFTEILDRLPLTLEIAFLAVLFSVVIAVPVGVIAAVRQNHWIDYLFRSITIAGLAVPSFWIGTMTILFMTLAFRWSPPLGYVAFTEDPWANLQQLTPPALVIGFGNAAVIARMTRSAMLEVLKEDFVRTATSRGLSPVYILCNHALRNAMLPIMTLVGIELGSLLGGTVVMETIFTLPGIGRFLVDSIIHRDYPVVQTIVLIMGAQFVILNLLIDILNGLLDPRIRYQ
jgi:peptide/nickel transport system permease protein